MGRGTKLRGGGGAPCRGGSHSLYELSWCVQACACMCVQGCVCVRVVCVCVCGVCVCVCVCVCT